MAQTGYTPILIYSSSTASNAPAVGNLTNSTLGSELAINITDGKLFYKDNANAIQVIGWKTTPTTAGGTGLTSYTAGDLLYYATGTTLSKLAIGASGRWLGSSGTAPQWNAPAALTKTDDTNVTLTLGGSASTALLNAASLTLGWTGTLATTRGGTGLSSFTANGIVYASSTSALATGSALTWNGTVFAIAASGNSTSFQSTTSSTAYNAAVMNNSGGAIAWGVDNVAGTAFNGLAYAGVIGTSNATAFEIFTNNAVRQTWFSSGGVSIGNQTDPGATNLSVTGTVKGANGLFSKSGNVSTTSGVAATLFTVGSGEIYLVSVVQDNGDGNVFWTGTTTGRFNTSITNITTIASGFLTAGASGTSFQITQSTGSTRSLNWFALKLCGI